MLFRSVLGGSYNTRGITVEGENEAAPDKRWAFVDVVSEEYFATLGISLARGRFFTKADAAPSFRAAVVNEAFVRTFLGERDALGARIGTGPRGTPLEIIWVAKDSAYSWVKSEAGPVVYLSAAQDPGPDATTFYVRSSLGSDTVNPAIRAALREIDQIGYIRFASVYQSFEDLATLKREVDMLVEEKGAGGGKRRRRASVESEA